VFTAALVDWLYEQAIALGFDALGVSAIQIVPATFPQFERWVEDEFYGTMTYLPRGRERRKNPQLILPEAKTIVSVAVNYFLTEPTSEQRKDPSRGQIALYAQGQDYHDVMLPKLRELGRLLDDRCGSKSKAYVDTGALLERDFAASSGLGFIGKNTCLINPRHGSYFLLGELITTAQLTTDDSKSTKERVGCGSCTRCLTACPTNAFVDAFRLDARRCISYLTIENRGDIPEELRPAMKNWVFGCDDCQTCCPWNRFANPVRPATSEDYERFSPPLTELALLTKESFHERFRDTPILRPGRDAFLRSVAIALANWGSTEAFGALEFLTHDTSELVRSHAKWGLSKSSGSIRL